MNSKIVFPAIYIQNDNQFTSKSPCTIEFKDNHISLKISDKTLLLNMEDVIIKKGGAGLSYLFFEHKQLDQNSFYLKISKSLNQHLKVINSNIQNIHLQKHLKDNAKLKLNLVFTSALIFMIGFTFLYKSQALINMSIDLFPVSVEDKIGGYIVKSVIPPSKKILNANINKKFEDILKPLLIEKNIIIHLSKEMEVNAYALPGGHIIFNQGMLLKAETADEVLAVAAHELAHVNEKHLIKSFLKSSSLFFAFQVILGDISGLLALVANNFNFIVNQSFSRDFEKAADQAAFNRLVQLELDPRGLIDFFTRLEKIKNTKMQETILVKYIDNLEFLQTHPNEATRIEIINNMYDNLPSGVKNKLKKSTNDYKKFKISLKKLI